MIPQGNIVGAAKTSGGGATIPSTTDLIAGNGSGGAADSGIAPSNVVTAAANITDTALVKGFAGAKGVATTGILVDASNNTSGIGTLASGAHTITSASANALTVGLNGATNPAFNVDDSTALSATGINIKSAAAAGGVVIGVISSATNENATLNLFKGTGTGTINGAGLNVNSGGNLNLQSGGSTQAIIGGGGASFTYSFRGFTAATAYTFSGLSDTNLSASTECMSFDLNFAQTKTHQTGAQTLQRDIRLRPSTHAYAAASTLATAYGVSIDGAPIAGTNATITTSATLNLGSNAVGAATTNSYGLFATANTGATANYIASLNGSAGEVMRIRTDGQVNFLNTVTPTGTTGAQTINQPSGTVNFAAAASTLVVTNSLCTVNSLVFAQLRKTDATLTFIKSVVPAAGSFTINGNVAATAETSCAFLIINV